MPEVAPAQRIGTNPGHHLRLFDAKRLIIDINMNMSMNFINIEFDVAFHNYLCYVVSMMDFR